MFDILMWASLFNSKNGKPPNALKNKGSLLAFMVPRGTINIHGIFTLQQRFFIVKKGYLDY